MQDALPQRAHRLSGRMFLVAVALATAVTLLVFLALFAIRGSDGSAAAAVSQLRLEDIPFDGSRAYEYLKQICALGRRPSGSPGMQAQQTLLAEHFRKLGAQVELQRFQFPHPQENTPVQMANLLVHWHPERPERILFCTHYDTLPYPLRDRQNPRGTFLGANDGGSGAALLMALGHMMPQLPTRYGVDFVFFDAEEFMFREDGRFFLGSEFFSRQYVENPAGPRYRWGVLLDMVGDADLQLYQERNSVGWADTRPLVEQIWGVARRLGVREFIAERKHEVSDDHLPLHNLAQIPTCDIIDFDYPDTGNRFWHTQADTPEHCSALSLAKVGWVLVEWLKGVK